MTQTEIKTVSSVCHSILLHKWVWDATVHWSDWWGLGSDHSSFIGIFL